MVKSTVVFILYVIMHYMKAPPTTDDPLVVGCSIDHTPLLTRHDKADGHSNNAVICSR